jgi:hypothetical protein
VLAFFTLAKSGLIEELNIHNVGVPLPESAGISSRRIHSNFTLCSEGSFPGGKAVLPFVHYRLA